MDLQQAEARQRLVDIRNTVQGRSSFMQDPDKKCAKKMKNHKREK